MTQKATLPEIVELNFSPSVPLPAIQPPILYDNTEFLLIFIIHIPAQRHKRVK